MRVLTLSGLCSLNILHTILDLLLRPSEMRLQREPALRYHSQMFAVEHKHCKGELASLL